MKPPFIQNARERKTFLSGKYSVTQTPATFIAKAAERTKACRNSCPVFEEVPSRR